MATWPSGLRRQNQDLVLRGGSSNLPVVSNLFFWIIFSGNLLDRSDGNKLSESNIQMRTNIYI